MRQGTWVGRERPLGEPPYWVDIWPASRAAVWALARHPDLHGLRLLDLGCGIGLPGIAAAAGGAEVTFCDGEPDALAFAEWNARRVAGSAAQIHTIAADWNAVTLDREFDILVMADITYRLDQQSRLLELATTCLREAGVVLHADPDRVESTRFLRGLARAFELGAVHRAAPHRDHKVAVRLTLGGAARPEAWLARLAAAGRQGAAAQ